MSLKNKYERVIIRNNMSLGLSSCAYEYLLNLEQEKQQLEERIKQYENPEDLTLMFMYCEENAKDKIKELQQENKQLKILIESLKLGVTLNREQEKLLDSILLGSGKYEQKRNKCKKSSRSS